MLERIFLYVLQKVLGQGNDISPTNPLPVTSETAIDHGTATGGTVNTLQDTLKGWQVNIFQDAVIEIIDATTGISYTREIDSNTADTINFATHPLPVAVDVGDTYFIRRTVNPVDPISRDNQFNVLGYMAGNDIIAAGLAPLNTPCNFRVEAAFSAGGVLDAVITQGGVPLVVHLNGGVALNVNALYRFNLMVNATDTINFRYGAGCTILTFKVQEIIAAAE